VLKKIAALGLSMTPVKMRDGVDAIALDAEPPDALFAQHRLHTQASDDRLLASFVEFREKNAGNRVLILSCDSGLGVKARSRKTELVMPAETLELPDEPDEVERELEKAKREVAELKSAAPDLTLTFGNGKTHATFEMRSVAAFDAGTLGRLLGDWRKRHPHISGMPDDVELLGQVVSFKGLEGVPGFVSQADAAKHNAAIDRYYNTYEMFLQTWPVTLNTHFRILKFNFVLENDGTAPGDDVDLQLWTDASGTWLKKVPKLPIPPVVPKPRSIYDSVLDVRMPFLDHMPRTAFLQPAANEDGPNILEEGSGQRVQYGIKRVKHHVPCELPAVYFQFDTDADVRSFRVIVRLVAANIRKPKDAFLDVQVTRKTAEAPPPPSKLDDDDGA